MLRSVDNAEMAIGSSRSCRFCTLPDRWRIVLETENFCVLMGLGPIVTGYCIIITKEHYGCSAELSPQHFGELQNVIDLVQASQRASLGGSILFEHGRNGGCLPHGHDDELCYHAHIHLLPAAINLAAAVRDDYPTEPLPDWSSLAARYASDRGSYLLIQDGSALAYVPDPEALPGRYLRSKAAEQLLGDSLHADWQAFPGYDMIRAGKQLLERQLREGWEQGRRRPGFRPGAEPVLITARDLPAAGA